MGSLTVLSERLEKLLCQARAQVNALKGIKKVFAREAKHLHRHDQALCLDALRAEVQRMVRHIQTTEAAASWSFTKASLTVGLAEFAIGSLIAVAASTRENPVAEGLRLAEGRLSATAPFGVVLVAMRPGGVPDDVEVISLSRLAREQGRSESEIRTALEARGYTLMTPEAFSATLDRLRRKLLKGTAALPVAASSFVQKKPTRRTKAAPFLPTVSDL